jgi:hypothetical protein
MARTRETPAPGSYVEMRRGCYVIVARVIWTDEECFGAKTQDILPLDQIVREPDSAAPAPDSNASMERRQVPRKPTIGTRHDRSRQISRTMEFGFVLFCSVSIAAAALASFQQAFARPLNAVATVLGGPAGSR